MTHFKLRTLYHPSCMCNCCRYFLAVVFSRCGIPLQSGKPAFCLRQRICCPLRFLCTQKLIGNFLIVIIQFFFVPLLLLFPQTYSIRARESLFAFLIVNVPAIATAPVVLPALFTETPIAHIPPWRHDRDHIIFFTRFAHACHEKWIHSYIFNIGKTAQNNYLQFTWYDTSRAFPQC